MRNSVKTRLQRKMTSEHLQHQTEVSRLKKEPTVNIEISSHTINSLQ